MFIPAAQKISARNRGVLSMNFDTRRGGGILNGIVVEDDEGLIVEKRFGFDKYTLPGVPTYGAGDYLHACGVSNGTSLYVVETTVPTLYEGATSRGAVGVTVDPTEKFHIDTLDAYAIILNRTDNRGYTLTGGTLAQITDPNFPTDLAYGCAVLNGRAYVGSQAQGRIYNSAEGDPTTYSALGYIASSFASDTCEAVLLHRNNVVSFGARSITYFFDQGNSVGTPLRRREDVMHHIGLREKNSLSEIGGMIFFIGSFASSDDRSDGKRSVFMMVDFICKKVSTDAIDAFINNPNMYESAVLNGTCMMMGNHGRPVYVLTQDVDGGTYKCTFVYDIEKDFWYEWSYQTSGYFPIMGRTKEGVALRNGDVLFSNGNTNLRDDDGTNFKFGFRSMANQDAGGDWVAYRKLHVIGDYLQSGSWSVRYTDNDFGSYSTARTLSATGRASLSALGSSSKRSWEVTYTGTSNARIRGIRLITDRKS